MNNGRPGMLFGTKDLDILERPWQNGTTGDLLAKAIVDVDLSGNFYATVGRRQDGKGRKIVRLRPDWVTIILGSNDPNVSPSDAVDPNAELVGYVFTPGGMGSGLKPRFYLPDECMHWAPIPDPSATYRGMSWVQPVLAEVLGDRAMTQHKEMYFVQGATPNLVVTLDTGRMDRKTFREWTELFEDEHAGAMNAYRTLYLGLGANAQVIGSQLKDLDYAVVQGHGEPLALDTPIPTPSGWTTMGEVQVGDEVFGRSGKPIRVLDVLPVHVGRTCFRVRFSDATSIVADEHHLWTAIDYRVSEEERQFTTSQLYRLMRQESRLEIPAGLPVELPRAGFTSHRPSACGSTDPSFIVSIEPVESVPVRCIAVDCADHLFRAGEGWTLTHNTRIAAAAGIPAIIVGFSEGLESSTYCLPYSSRVLTPTGLTPIGRLRPGDEVWSHVDGGLSVKRVIRQQRTGVKPVYTIRTRNRVLRASGNHPVLTRIPGHSSASNEKRSASTEWRRVDELAPGDQIVQVAEIPFAEVAEIPFADPVYRERVEVNQGRYRPAGGDAQKAGLRDGLGFFTIRSIEVGPPEDVYDIEVEGGHSFVAEGVVVHNSNFSQARRACADKCLRPLWRNFAGSLETLVPSPPGSSLWYDDRDIPFLKADAADDAAILLQSATTIRVLVDAGYDPDSVVAAVASGDVTLLKHTGLYSVQLQPAGTNVDPQTALPSSNGGQGSASSNGDDLASAAGRVNMALKVGDPLQLAQALIAARAGD